MMDNEWLVFYILLGVAGGFIILPRIYCAITRRSPWSVLLLQRVQTTSARWTEVLAYDWAMLLGRVREMSKNGGESHGARRFVLGGLALLVGPVVAVLNAVILAQILEIFLPGSSQTLSIPYVGDLMPFPFIAAVIIAGVEVIAAIALWHAPHLAWRISAGVVALVAVAAETTGGYIRARVLAGADDLSGTGAAGLLGVQTAGVSALISFLAPSAEMIAGALLFDGLLEPLGHHILRIFRIIPLWVLRGAGNILFGPFLREPYLSEPVVNEITEPPADIESPAEVAQPAPLIHAVIQQAENVSQAIVDNTAALNTGVQALSLEITGLLGAIAGFIATKVKTGPKHNIELHPAPIVAEFNKTLDMARNQQVFQECQHMAGDTVPRNPAHIYAGFSREMLLEELDTFDRKRSRLELLVRFIAQGALQLAVGQLDRLRQTDAFLWSQDPEAKVEWEGLRTLERTLEEQVRQVERRLLHAVTLRQETLQGLNDLVESPLLAEMWERSQAENLRQIKLIATRLGCEPWREGFSILAALFSEMPAEHGEAAAPVASRLPAWVGRTRDMLTHLLPGATAEFTVDALEGRLAVRLLLDSARGTLSTCKARLEDVRSRLHEVTDQLVQVHCQECPEMLCALCPHCEHLKLTMRAQAAELDEDCSGFERMLTIRIGQLRRLAKRKTFFGRLFAWLDDWKEGEAASASWQEIRR